LTDLSTPDWRDRTALAVEELKMTGTMQPFEKEYFRKDGSRVPVLIGAATFEQGGKQGVAFVLDLTERKCAEAAVRESEEKWRAAFENNPTMYFMVDASGIVLSVNPFGAEQLGYTVDELTGDSVLKVLQEDDRAAVQLNTTRCLEQLGKPMTWEARKVRKDGSMLWVRETARAMLMMGRPVVLTACEDMTQRKRAEEDLRRSEAFLAEAQRLTRTGSWAWDSRSQKVLYCSEEMFRIFGLDRESLPTRKRFRERVHPDDRAMVDERFERSLREKVDSFDEYRIILPDGTLKYINSSGHPVLDDDGNLMAFVGTAVDVTERKRAQEEHERLRQLESDLAHMNRVSIMGELAASLAHEITQPIASARNNARAAINFLDKQPPEFAEVREALGGVVGDADRAGDIIDRIRDHIKKAPPRKDHFDFNEAVKEVIVLAHGAITKNDVSVQTRFAEGLLPVHGDRVQLQQVVLNLILNAVDAMGSFDAGERKLLVSIEQSQTNGILATVRDTGPGIAPEHRERVFETFYTTKSGGVGMGLSICRSIIDAHGGRLWADANEPRGAVFHLALPTSKEVDFPSGGSRPTAGDHADATSQPVLSAKHDN
jgi:PAS domain S-box-containing protein